MTLPASLPLSCGGWQGSCAQRLAGGSGAGDAPGPTGSSALLVGRDPHGATGPAPGLSTKGCHGLTLPLTATASF